MKAFMQRSYGRPDILRLEDVEKPAVGERDVLVRVCASSVNQLEWHQVTGRPYLIRLGALRAPKDPRVGVDFAGVVEAVGAAAAGFQVGDEVFGCRSGAYAEYVSVPDDKMIVKKPATVTLEEAGCVGIAGITALEAVRDRGGVKAGDHVLVNGASGGVGTFAVQIAKALGAEVTAVCSTANVEQAKRLGADHVIDYRREDFTEVPRKYDVMIDIAGNRPWSACKRVLARDAIHVGAGGPDNNALIGPFASMIAFHAAGLGSSQKKVAFIASITRERMEFLGQLMASERVKPAIDRRYSFKDLPQALAYLGEGHARAKVAISIP